MSREREPDGRRPEPAATRPPAGGPVLPSLRFLCQSPLSAAGLVVVGLASAAALLAPWIAPYDPAAIDLANTGLPPGGAHPLGTDDLGRDVASRLLYGARVSLLVGVVATAVAAAIGTALGAAAGFFGGAVDLVLMRIADVIFAFPTALFALAVLAVFEHPSVTLLFLVLGFIGWAGYARIARAEILRLREEPFAEAARALGAGPARLLFRHLLPNGMAPILVAVTSGVAGNILTESWLSFLGMGAQPPTPSWGMMITEGQPYLTTRPWLCVFPGIAIASTVLGFNLLGDGLRDLLDPWLRRGGRA